LSILGAVGFGALIGWFVYYINRYRKGDVQFSDLTTVVAIIGGGVVVNLFQEPALFGAYGIGLFLGFFGYFVSMLLLIRSSDNFDADFLLDGRRRVLDGSGFYIPGAAEGFVRPAMIPQFPVQAGAAHDLTTLPAQAPMLASLESAATAAATRLPEETRQAQASAEALRIATLDAQRTLAALAQTAEKAGQGSASRLQPTPEPGD
jgi:hypothetical protein